MTEWIVQLKAAPTIRVAAKAWEVTRDGAFINFTNGGNSCAAWVAVDQIVAILESSADRSS